MYQLRLPCLDSSGQFYYNQQVAVYLADGVTPAPVLNDDDEPRSHLFMTDASGFIQFRLATLISLTFRTVTGTVHGPVLPLYNAGVGPTPPAEVNTVGSGIVGATAVNAGYAITTDGSGLLRQADAENVADLNTVIGIAIQTGSPGSSVNYVSNGYVTNTGWSFTVRKPLFVGINGELIHAPLPGTLTFIQQIGVAVSATTAMINLSPAIKR